KLYVGATFGIQSVNWKRQIYYGEDYLYSSTPVYGDGTPMATPAEWMDYNQAVVLKGAGVNFKLGLIYRPLPSLRIGAAIHTPTYYSLERSYQSYMATNFHQDGDTTPALDDVGENSWEFCSPTRLMFGLSYAFGKFAVLSVDYERDWYNGIRVKNIPSGFDMTPQDYRQEFKDNFKASNIVRVGAEIKPLPFVALRAGYGYSDGALRNDYSAYYNRPLTYRTVCYSGGVGMAFGRTTLDLTYQRLVQSQTSYMLYYALENTGTFDTASPYYSTEYNRNNVILTLGYRF
ncbi:MAG: transporter, partial [Alistipes sp.]|nr:transporter [Alistipes sp.]